MDTNDDIEPQSNEANLTGISSITLSHMKVICFHYHRSYKDRSSKYVYIIACLL